MANMQCEAPYSRIRRYSRSQTVIRCIRSRWTKPPRLYWRAQRRTRRFEGPILRIHNAGQSEGASHSARVSKHQSDVCGYGGRIYRANFGDPRGGVGGEYRLLDVPICECAMRGSLALHYARLTSSCTKQASLSTAIVLKRKSSRCRRDIAFSRS